MAIMWSGSLVPWLDPNGTPYSGAKAFFFNAETTTPRTVYEDGGLNEAHDHPVVANASGMFPAIFLPSGDYRLRLETAAGVTIWDVDGISTPSIGDDGGGGGGDTPTELLWRTGFSLWAYMTGTLTGFVRMNGRTIGDASSGASERANADCEDLFIHLWNQDPTLAVSGGRGSNAAADWATSKTIATPDMRLRGPMGMASMGATASSIIAAGAFDNSENGDDLGATIGTGTVTLTVNQMPNHNHGGNTGTEPGHVHGIAARAEFTGGGGTTAYVPASTFPPSSSGVHANPPHNHSISPQGGGQAHSNVQPSMVGTWYIHL